MLTAELKPHNLSFRHSHGLVNTRLGNFDAESVCKPVMDLRDGAIAVLADKLFYPGMFVGAQLLWLWLPVQKAIPLDLFDQSIDGVDLDVELIADVLELGAVGVGEKYQASCYLVDTLAALVSV